MHNNRKLNLDSPLPEGKKTNPKVPNSNQKKNVQIMSSEVLVSDLLHLISDVVKMNMMMLLQERHLERIFEH